MFAERAPDMLSQLQALLDGTDEDAIAKQAHALKSMALSSGFGRLAEALRVLEAKSTSHELEMDRAPTKETLERLLDASRSAASEYLEQAALRRTS
jgi:HPt (histidine-containing phosphotransfer) domain-containing protein